jgi:hypothetical protein
VGKAAKVDAGVGERCHEILILALRTAGLKNESYNSASKIEINGKR